MTKERHHLSLADLEELEHQDYNICSDEERLMVEDIGCWNESPPPPSNIADFPHTADSELLIRFNNL